jgi:hypothetical protein
MRCRRSHVLFQGSVPGTTGFFALNVERLKTGVVGGGMTACWLGEMLGLCLLEVFMLWKPAS